MVQTESINCGTVHAGTRMTCTATPLAALMYSGLKLKFATTAARSTRALPLWCGPERIIISVCKTRPNPLILQTNLRFRWPYKTLKIYD